MYVSVEDSLHGRRNVGNPRRRWLEQEFGASGTVTGL
jgi:hypothetical protein